MGLKIRQRMFCYLLMAGMLGACDCDCDGNSADGINSTPAPMATEFPIRPGEVGMIHEDNPRQRPFACQTFKTVLGQPQIDNQSGIGYPVTNQGSTASPSHDSINEADIIGYSADCGAPMQINYFYKSIQGTLKPLPDRTARPFDMATLGIGGKTYDYIVRQEIGTLNRFIYAIYLLTPNLGTFASPDLSAWNGNLVFNLRGGFGIGYSQANGNITLNFVSRPDGGLGTLALLERGYAVASSTGMSTETTPDFLLAGQTAEMIKRQFVAAYAEPDYTFGFGVSGGAAQQRSYEQNVPELLDALLLMDIGTGESSRADCELLEFYFDRVDAMVNGTGMVNPKWRDWESRRLIEGFNARNNVPTRFDDGTGRPYGSSADPGSSMCIEDLRGVVPVGANPHFVSGDAYELIRQTEPEVYAQTRFSYYESLKHILGTDPASGYARITYDNVGVQYGLKALVDGDITVDEFLLFNAHVGGYKQPWEFVSPGFPFQGENTPENLDPWSSRNATARDHMIPGDVAPRTEGDLGAMRAAYTSGLAFLGDLDAPMLVIDGYQERQLDQHHSRAKFELRELMLQADGDADNLVLWTVDTVEGGHAEPIALALSQGIDLLRKWLEDGTKPETALDACFSSDGSEIARGADVYNGVLTDTTSDDGACVAPFPVYGTPRSVAGAGLNSRMYKCHLKPVDIALTDGTYGSASFTAAQQNRLREIFADGVCDYDQPDQAMPDTP